jgi:hypothetical protein
MTRSYRDDPLTKTRLVRDATDALRRVPELRNVGLAVRRTIAAVAVDAALSSARQEDTKS